MKIRLEVDSINIVTLRNGHSYANVRCNRVWDDDSIADTSRLVRMDFNGVSAETAERWRTGPGLVVEVTEIGAGEP